MKLRSIIAALALTLMLPVVCNAQLTEDQVKQRNAAKSELNEKAVKDARKQAKQMEKEGWMVMPGQLTLERQSNKSMIMKAECDENGYEKYFFGGAASIAENYDAGKLQANELARQELAGKISSSVVALIENSVANQQLSNDEAASIAQTISAGKNLIAQKLGRVITVMECYRVKSNNNKEVRIELAYSYQMALAAAKAAMREELEQKSEDLQNKLDEIIGW